MKYANVKRDYHVLAVRFPHDDMAALREHSRLTGKSLNELILTFVTWGLEDDYKDRDLVRASNSRNYEAHKSLLQEATRNRAIMAAARPLEEGE